MQPLRSSPRKSARCPEPGTNALHLTLILKTLFPRNELVRDALKKDLQAVVKKLTSARTQLQSALDSVQDISAQFIPMISGF